MQYDDNLTAERPSFVTHLECAMTGERHEADQIHNLSRAGKPLLVRYDLAGVAQGAEQRSAGAARRPICGAIANCCRCARRANIVSLGEAMTPLIRMPQACKASSAAATSW